MRWLLIIIVAFVLCACSSVTNTLKYGYLPGSKYQYYTPLNPVDLKGKSYRLTISDRRTSNRISCTEIILPRDTELEGDIGFDYFSNYLKAMIEENNGKIDQENGQEIKIELLGISNQLHGFAYLRIWGLVEFSASVDGNEKAYCSAMGDGDHDAPVGKFSVDTRKGASRKLVSGSVRRAFEEFMHDLSKMN